MLADRTIEVPEVGTVSLCTDGEVVSTQKALGVVTFDCSVVRGDCSKTIWNEWAQRPTVTFAVHKEPIGFASNTDQVVCFAIRTVSVVTWNYYS